MSKLYSIYLNEKEKAKDTILLFKTGIFYIAIDTDALFLSNMFEFKLTNLNNNIKKCGFPCSSIDKYLNLFKKYNLSVNIIDIDKNTKYNLEYFNSNILEILELLQKVDINNLSVSEAYAFIKKLKYKATNNI